MDETEEVDAAAHKLFEEIRPLVEELVQLQEMQVAMLTPEIERIIRNHVTDTHVIESVLDRLIDCAGTSSGLQQFKKLCRYFWTIDPVLTAWHVNEYRKWYEEPDDDEDELDEQTEI